ncbi:MAG TPA: hypothetical protein VGC89_03775 [Pyrinomonadaceae bacterium]
MFQKRFLISTCSLMLLCAASLLSVAPARDASLRNSAQEERGQRIRPPENLDCSRNDLTSFTGRALSYSRSNTRLFLRMRTDEQTTENFTLSFGQKDGPAKWFLLRAEPFKAEDWKLIETRRGRLRPGMRATVWVCQTNRKPVIDWQPPER